MPNVEAAVPTRAATAGDALLATLPEGADVLVEVDLARLRDNEVIGDLAARAIADPGVIGETARLGGALDAAAVARADALMLASYGVGTAQAVTHVLYVGDGLELPDLGAIPGHTLADDRTFLRLRTAAMPAEAEGASLRLTARLGFDARVALASQLGFDAAPASVSAWGDVADDLAVVAVIDAGEVGGGAVADEVGKAMAKTIRGWLADLAGLPAVRAIGLSPVVRAFQVEPREAVVTVIALIGPNRLDRAAGRARTLLSLTGASP